jgi:hypothetical protein
MKFAAYSLHSFLQDRVTDNGNILATRPFPLAQGGLLP